MSYLSPRPAEARLSTNTDVVASYLESPASSPVQETFGLTTARRGSNASSNEPKLDFNVKLKRRSMSSRSADGDSEENLKPSTTTAEAQWAAHHQAHESGSSSADLGSSAIHIRGWPSEEEKPVTSSSQRNAGPADGYFSSAQMYNDPYDHSISRQTSRNSYEDPLFRS